MMPLLSKQKSSKEEIIDVLAKQNNMTRSDLIRTALEVFLSEVLS